MVKIIDHGWTKPDDPIYQTGPVIGGVRLSRSPKSGAARPRTSEPGAPSSSEKTESEATEPEA